MNRRVGTYYGLAGLVVLAAAGGAMPWSLILVWPSASLLVVMTGYFGRGVRIFRKRQGRIPLATRLVLAPVLAGQHLSLRYYRRQCRAWDEVVPGVWIGRVLSQAEAADAVARGVTSVLDLTGEFAEAEPFRRVHYRNLPILDLTAPTQDQLREAVTFIKSRLTAGTVYVHCKIGYSRSAAVAGAYLLETGLVRTVEDAVAWLERVRPTIVVRPEVATALREFGATTAVSRS